MGSTRGGGQKKKHHTSNETGEVKVRRLLEGHVEREMCPWAISKYFGDLVPNTGA
jgi:hypothetical protein